MSRNVCLVAVFALMLVCAGPAQAVIYGPHGAGGTFNAYQWITNDRSWDAARYQATQLSFLGESGHLVTIGSADENTFANRIAIGTEKWLGLTDSTATSTQPDFFNAASLGTFEAGNTSGQPLPPAGMEPVSGQRGFGWKWVDGTPYTFQSWNGGEPNNSGTENAAHFTGSAGLWNDNKAGATISNGPDNNRDSLVEYNTNIQLSQLSAWKATIVKVQDVITPGVTVSNLAEAKQVIAGTRGPLEPSFNGGSPLTQQRSTVNFVNPHPGNTGFITGDTAYPGLSGASDNFVISVAGSFTATSGGLYTFGVNSDDGFGLLIRDPNNGNAVVNFQDWSGQNNATSNDVNQTQVVGGELRFSNGRGHSSDVNAVNAAGVASYGRINLNPGGLYNFELVHWEGTGGTASLEAFYMLGTPNDYLANMTAPQLSFSDGTFTVLGGAGDLVPSGDFNVTTRKLFNQINHPDITTLAQADQALNGTFAAPTAAGFPLMAHYSHININNAGSGNPTGTFGAYGAANGHVEDPVFGLGTVDDFVVQAMGLLYIPQDGFYTFGVHSDDGSRLRIDEGGDGFTDADNLIAGNGVQNFVYATRFLEEGLYPIEFTWFERSGNAGAEVFAAFNPLNLTMANGTNPLTVTNGLDFNLVGDIDNGGLRVVQDASAIAVPEPATLGLGLLGLLALAQRRRRVA